jgi:hypothetical protein
MISSYSYYVTRERGRRFESRDEYVNAHVPAKYGGDKRFCQAVQAVVKSSHPALFGQLEEQEDGAEQGDPWVGFPWLTLVLGSGCLELPTEPSVTADTLARAVGQSVRDRLDDISLAADAQDFTRSLARDRLGVAAKGTPSSTGVPELFVNPIAVRLVLVAGLLTRLYHDILSRIPTAFSRWEDDVALLPPYRMDELGDRDSGLPLLLSEMTGLTSILEDRDPRRSSYQKIDAAVAGLLREVADDLRPLTSSENVEVWLDQVRLVTEVAWQYLVDGTSIYPGWTDLLLGLMLREDDALKRRGRPRPQYTNLQKLPEVVSKLLQSPTEASWRALEKQAPGNSDRDRLYLAAAEVLWAEADALLRLGTDANRVPPASAFVTSFDLELDMALWVLAEEGAKFSVALPVHIARRRGVADFCWLLGDVERVATKTWDEGLEKLAQPKNWRLLTPQLDARTELRSGPVVVHLGGCPLFRLPDFKKQEEASVLIHDLVSVGIYVQPETRITHAVTVDEYLALRQSEAEIFWISRNVETGRSLHPDLVRDGERNHRFWMAIGVPIADPAVRHRVASQMTAGRLGENSLDEVSGPGVDALASAKRPPRPPSRSGVDGVAVNLHIDPEEANLLFWLGLDVIAADAREFILDLRHYALHVDHDGPGKRSPLDEECALLSARGT